MCYGIYSCECNKLVGFFLRWTRKRVLDMWCHIKWYVNSERFLYAARKWNIILNFFQYNHFFKRFHINSIRLHCYAWRNIIFHLVDMMRVICQKHSYICNRQLRIAYLSGKIHNRIPPHSLTFKVKIKWLHQLWISLIVWIFHRIHLE